MIKIGAALLIAAVVVPPLTACSSPSKPTATLVAGNAKIAPGESLRLSGAFSKQKAGLAVQLESGGPVTFVSTGTSATTDGSGAYTFSYKPYKPGAFSFRVEVTDGTTKTDSPAVQVTILGATSIAAALVGSSEVGRGTPAAITGTLRPATSGRAITLESSPDGGTTWSPTGVSTRSAPTGAFKVNAPTQTAGAQLLRISVAENGAQAAATSASIRVYVADYKTAGAKYLACVKGGNAAQDVINKAVDEFNAGTLSFADFARSFVPYGAAMKAEITCLTGYTWPPSVANLVKDLADQVAVDVDISHQESVAKTIDALNALSRRPELTASYAQSSADASKIRHGLGLPPR